MRKYYVQNNLSRKAFISPYISQTQSTIKGSQGGDTGQEPKGRIVEAYSTVLFSCLSYKAQANGLGMLALTVNGLDSPVSASNQENALQMCPQAKLMEAKL